MRLRRNAYRDDDPDSQFARLERGELSLDVNLTCPRRSPGAETIWDPQSAHFFSSFDSDTRSRGEDLSVKGTRLPNKDLTNNIVEAWPMVNDGCRSMSFSMS